MNLIDHLHSIVTPQVLPLVADHAGDKEAKRGVLSSFFGIFGARLSDPDTLDRIQSLSFDNIKDGNYVLDAVLQDDEGNSQVSILNGELAKEHNISEKTVGLLTTAAAPLVFEEFKSSVGTGSILAFLQDKIHDLAAYLPDWAEKLLPLGLITGAVDLAADTVSGTVSSVTGAITGNNKESHATHVNGQITPIKEEEESNFTKALLPIIGLVIFAGLAWLLLRSCQEKPAPVAAPVTPPSKTINQFLTKP